MANDRFPKPSLTPHGALRLPAVDVEAYNTELKDEEGFVGDRANKGAFRRFLDDWRKPLHEIGQDPFGDAETTELTKKKLDALLAGGDPEAAGVVQGAIESFAQELSLVLQRFLKLKGWKDTERIVIGGGFSGRRVGELAIGRTSVLLKAEKIKVEITTIRNEPDEAGLLGAIHLAPPWIFKAHDAILAVAGQSWQWVPGGSENHWPVGNCKLACRSKKSQLLRIMRIAEQTGQLATKPRLLPAICLSGHGLASDLRSR
jgi:hypothetical protein